MRIRVLIADDHAVVAEGLEQLIGAEPGFEALGRAADGEEAVRLALELEPDVVVMDVAMPRMNGIDATAAIRERLPKTQVIMLSMYSNAEYVQRATAAGANGYLAKRSATRELIEAVRTVHAGRRYYGGEIAQDAVARSSRDAPSSPLATLSARERQVMKLLAEGKSVAQIGTLLGISPKTVETYRARLFAKLHLHDLPSLVRFAIQHEVIPLS